ncbi:hypothetical protein [Actinocorallia lasiicapitis]
MTQRLAGAVGTVVVAVAVNVATGLLTEHRAVVWWVSGITLILVGVLVQYLLPVTASAGGRSRLRATGNIVGGSLTMTAGGVAELDASDNEVGGSLSQSAGEGSIQDASRNRVTGDFTQNG